MPLRFPSSVNTPTKKMEFCLQALKKLKLEHNVLGARVRDGRLSLDKFRNYQKGRYTNIKFKIMSEYSKAKMEMQQASDYIGQIDLDEINNE